MGLFNTPDVGSRMVADCASLQRGAKLFGDLTRITALPAFAKSQVDTAGPNPASRTAVTACARQRIEADADVRGQGRPPASPLP